nr:MAG TPA: hypothetical protein [Caudoviricetes sp.]
MLPLHSAKLRNLRNTFVVAYKWKNVPIFFSSFLKAFYLML